MKITEIEFTNYKAFYGEGAANKIVIPKGKNLLIYGENGSGKTSIYEGLKNLFLASNPIDGKPHFSRHLAVDEFINDPQAETKQALQKANIKITLDDFKGPTKQVIYGTPDGNVESDQDILEANKSNGFLSYRELLNTYLINDKDEFDFQKKLTELIVKDILAQTINIGTNSTYNYSTYDQSYYSTPRPNMTNPEWYNAVDRFNIGFKKDISDINTILNDLLRYFFQGFKIELSLVEVNIYKYEPQRFQVTLKCWHYGIDTAKNNESHVTILNEARLSALALCIYLSGIIIKSKQKTKIKFLFFDDIFIGLDTSNRIPLLKILNEYKVIEWKEGTNPQTGLIENQMQKNEDGSIKHQSTPFFNDYQIFITTYDYHWFETAKSYLPNSKWQTVEMYSHSVEGVDFEVPLIMPLLMHDNKLNYYNKAEFYFKKSKDYKDYPASANYLRKEFERLFKDLLYGKYSLKKDGNETVLLRELGDLRRNFEKMLKDLAFDYAPFSRLSLYTQTTLNPLSHDNLSKPVFKRELQETFALADKLIAINKILLIEKGAEVSLTTTNGGVTRRTNLILSVDVYRFTIEGISKNTPIFLTPLDCLEGETEKSLTHFREREIQKAFDLIYYIHKIKNASKGKNVYEEFKLKNGKSLADIINLKNGEHK